MHYEYFMEFDVVLFFLTSIGFMIRYMITASLVGFYSTPVIGRFLPVPHETSMLKVITNFFMKCDY